MNNINNEETVFDWISDNQDELVRFLQDLIRIPSVSGEELAIQNRLYKELETMDLNPEMVYPDEKKLREHKDFFETTSFVKYGYENRPNVCGLLKGTGGGRSLCLSGHVDVVSAEPLNQWTRGPWSGDIVDGQVVGRGSGDMKGGVAAMIFAVKAIQKCGIKLKGDVQVETTIEEEDGGIGGVLFLRLVRPKVDGAIIPEPSRNHSISLASAGVMYFRATTPGIPAHASTAHFGVNAIHNMMLVVAELEKLHKDRQARIRYPTAELDPKMKGRATTINIGVIRAGDWPSTVPGFCDIECRIGFPPGETREQVMAEVEAAVMKAADSDEWLGEKLPKVTWIGWKGRPHEIEETNPFVQQVKDSVKKVIGKDPPFTGGAAGLDTRFFVHHGIPAVTCGPETVRTHSYDESVDIESLVRTAQVIASTMIDWCGV